jgi:hypothetical protein
MWYSQMAKVEGQYTGRSAMATWGAGNFDSDGAFDFIFEQIERYVALINEIFADEEYRFLLDEDAETELMPSVEILILLCERCNNVLPEGLKVDAWKQRYLAMYDAQIDDLAPVPGFKEERRAVIERTFDRLLKHQR